MKTPVLIDRMEEVTGARAGVGELYRGLIWGDWAGKYTIAGVGRRSAMLCTKK